MESLNSEWNWPRVIESLITGDIQAVAGGNVIVKIQALVKDLV